MTPLPTLVFQILYTCAGRCSLFRKCINALYRLPHTSHSRRTAYPVASLLSLSAGRQSCLYFSHRYLIPVYPEHPMQLLQASLKQMYSKQQENRQQIERLAYSRKTEVDPYDYENFLMGIKELTETERKVFGYYLQGKTVKEIMELSGVKNRPSVFHNRNIYSKLQVSSLKQLRSFAAIMKQDDVSQQKQVRNSIISGFPDYLSCIFLFLLFSTDHL